MRKDIATGNDFLQHRVRQLRGRLIRIRVSETCLPSCFQVNQHHSRAVPRVRAVRLGCIRGHGENLHPASRDFCLSFVEQCHPQNSVNTVAPSEVTATTSQCRMPP